ncbi:MAG: glycosyltransferase family A protein [Bryobacteraceae bacterium]
MFDLAIVLPAFKPTFLASALESLARQTDPRFKVYIGNDAGPESIKQIVRSSNLSADRVEYQRYPTNLGQVSLVRHWDRCIKQCAERWILLFSDDDEMEPDCVSAFYKTLAETGGVYPLYRFNFMWIDGQADVLASFPELPLEQTAQSFLEERLEEKQQSCAQALIFSRAAYDEIGGFPEFPMAWMADDAFILSLAREKPIRTIPGPRVRWRRSALNISGAESPGLITAKLEAAMCFVRWLLKTFSRSELGGVGIGGRELSETARKWFDLRVAHDGSNVIPFRVLVRLCLFSWRTFGDNPFPMFGRLSFYDCRLILRRIRRALRAAPRPRLA